MDSSIVTPIFHCLPHTMQLLHLHRFCLRTKFVRGILNLGFLLFD